MIALHALFFFLDGVPRGLDERGLYLLVMTGLGIGLSNASEWAVQMPAP
jgi:hypothetical protein